MLDRDLSLIRVFPHITAACMRMCLGLSFFFIMTYCTNCLLIFDPILTPLKISAAATLIMRKKKSCTWVLEQALSVVTGLLKFVHLHLGVSCRDTFITWLLVCGFHFILCNCLDQDRDLNLSGNIPAKIIVKGTWKSSQPISRSTACRLSPALYLTVFFLYVIQEEADKPRILSSQRLSPKWCFLDCKYIRLLRFYSFPRRFYYLDTVVSTALLPSYHENK